MKFILLILMMAFAGILPAQNDICRKSTEGTDFWFGFMESRNYQDDHYLEITVTANEATTFRIAIGPGEIPFNETFTVEANNSVQVEIPWELVEATGSEEIQDKGIHLVSEKPVNVYALNWNMNSADVAVIYPAGSLGTEYFAMCYYPDIDPTNPFTGNGRNSEFLIVATQNATSVEITPSRVTDRGIPKDSTLTVILNKGQVYQVQSENILDSHLDGQGDLTGSFISASKPVAFYSGSLSTRVPSGQCCWDHLYEQIPPVHSWGLEYYLAPLKTRQQDRYRIMAAHDNTTIYISGRNPVTKNRGEFEEIVVFHNDPKRVLADKPVMVAQFSQSRDIDSEFTGGDGDPFMIILSPSNQERNEVTFVAYKSPDIDLEGYEGITKYFVNIITQVSETENIRLNGEPVAEKFQDFPGNNYAFAQVQIEAGTHHIENINRNAGFLAYVYGFGGVESYGYGVGFNLDLSLDLGESIHFQKDTLLLCFGDTITLDAGPYFDSYQWKTGETTQTIAINQPGWRHIKTTTFDGCELEDSVYVFPSNPEVDLGFEYLEKCMPFTAELSAGEEYNKYVWQNESGDTLSFEQTFTAAETGKYSITVFDEYNCTASDLAELKILPVPDTKFSGPVQVCGEKTSGLSVSVTGTPESLWNFEGSVQWSSNKPTQLTFSEITQTSVTIEVANWGDYEVYYRLSTTDGCLKTDTINIRFHPNPEIDFYFENHEECDGYSQKMFFTGIVTDSASFYWDLDGCQFLDTIGWQSYLISVGAFLQQPPQISLFVDDNGCFSDTIVKSSGANPNFTMDAGSKRGCDELNVDFTSRLLTVDNVEYLWEFDDGETASTQNFPKFYDEPGFYDVKLTITNPVTQCRNSFAIDSMIRVFPTPKAEIVADPDFCYPDTFSIIYSNRIDSSLCFWEFEGMHQYGGENDSIVVVLDNPTGMVKLTVNEFGCISSPAEMKLKRKPRFNFFAQNPEGCLPFETEIFAVTSDAGLEFTWITDSLPYPVGLTYPFTSTVPGDYGVGLTAYSPETGCADTLIKPGYMNVHPNPVAGFRIDFSVAILENARISFNNQSLGADFFQWKFGDGDSTFEMNPVHTYLRTGEFIAELIAESDFGCRDTARRLITVLPLSAHAPNAFRPGSPIEENRTFMPLYTGVDPRRFNLKIYDRNGQMAFESNSPFDPWDGIMPDGNDAPAGNYIWIAKYTDVQGIEREQKGQVLLIR
jgi:PKD repeat protein